METRTPSRRTVFRCLAALLLPPAFAGATPFLAEKVTGPEACTECHVEEISAWKRTKHAKTYAAMERRPETAAMLLKLGLGRIKAERQCQECHFLAQEADGMRQVVGGISCESCHGPAADWAKTHGDYGLGVTKSTEPAAHRDARWAQAIAAGMVRPENLHALGATCYACHILNDEKLANIGGHSTSSAGFNLLTWSQGEVRHTILHTGNKANPPATREHQRRLYVTGLVLELEYSLRAVARATENATYGRTLARRADDARKRLVEIQGLAPTPELGAIVDLAATARLRSNNATELAPIIDRLAALGRDFAARVTGAQLAGMDALLPGADQFKGQPYEVATQ